MGFLPRLFRHARLWELSREWIALRRGGHSRLELGAHTLGPYLPITVWDLLMRLARRPERVNGRTIGINPLAISNRLAGEIAQASRPAITGYMDDRTARRFCTQ